MIAIHFVWLRSSADGIQDMKGIGERKETNKGTDRETTGHIQKENCQSGTRNRYPHTNKESHLPKKNPRTSRGALFLHFASLPCCLCCQCFICLGAPNCTYENLGGNSDYLIKLYHQTTNQLKGNGAALIDLFE
jgi:hypothetical protein